MRAQVMTCLLRSAAMLVVLCPTPVAAQTLVEKARAVATVMDHRRTYLDDPLPFDACSVQRAMGGAGEFASHIAPQVRGMLDDASTPCPRPARSGRSVVLVDSVRFTADAARVYVTVLRGELIHREDYVLNPDRSSAAFMPVREVRAWGHSQAYSGGRGPSPDG